MKTKLISFAVLVALFLMACSSSGDYGEKLFTENFEPYPNTLTGSSRGDVDTDEDLKKVMAAYDEKNYDAALVQINQYLDKNPGYWRVKFYRGLVYLQKKDLDAAAKDFAEVITNNGEYKEEAEWYMALTMIRAGEKKEAVELLESMKMNNPSQGKKAANLLENIDKWPS